MRKNIRFDYAKPKYFYHYFRRSFRFIQIPFDLKEFEGKPVSVGVGRFGPYVKWGEALFL
jgi:hypothetical protein